MLNPRENMVVIDGQIKTGQIERCAINDSGDRYNIAFNNNPNKTFSYGRNRAMWLTNPVIFDPQHMELGILFHWEIMLHSGRDRYFSMACSAFQAKDYQAAERLFQKALEQPYEPGSPNTDALCYSNMGIACSSYRNYHKAFQCLKKAQSLGLTNASIERELLWLKNNVGLY